MVLWNDALVQATQSRQPFNFENTTADAFRASRGALQRLVTVKTHVSGQPHTPAILLIIQIRIIIKVSITTPDAHWMRLCHVIWSRTPEKSSASQVFSVIISPCFDLFWFILNRCLMNSLFEKTAKTIILITLMKNTCQMEGKENSSSSSGAAARESWRKL